MRHILETDEQGWLLIHELGCPGNLLNCELTMILRELTAPPKIGRFEVWLKRARDDSPRLVIGNEVPFWVPPPTGRRIGHVWKKEEAGIEFGRPRQ